VFGRKLLRLENVKNLRLDTVPIHSLTIVALFAGRDANGRRRLIQNGFFAALFMPLDRHLGFEK
jgi:hypothetical protein